MKEVTKEIAGVVVHNSSPRTWEMHGAHLFSQHMRDTWCTLPIPAHGRCMVHTSNPSKWEGNTCAHTQFPHVEGRHQTLGYIKHGYGLEKVTGSEDSWVKC